jgi:hypothetical protein
MIWKCHWYAPSTQMARADGERNSGSVEAVVHFSAPIRQLPAAHPTMLVS